ncbi:hypothetical protein COP2_002971 [Malus domestica]
MDYDYRSRSGQIPNYLPATSSAPSSHPMYRPPSSSFMNPQPSTMVSSTAKPSQNITVDHYPKDDDKKIRGTLMLMKKNFLELNDLKVSLQLISSVNCDPMLVVVQQRLIMLFGTEEHDQSTQFQLENQQKTQQMPLVIVKILKKKQKNRSGRGVHEGG